MAAAIAKRGVTVRPPRPGDGEAIARLWRELWEAHEAWGGYASARDEAVYSRLSVRLDEDARIRGNQPTLGRHVHLLATIDEQICGQVEGWFERHGVLASTPFTLEVRSLIVAPSARGRGLGRALLEALGDVSAGLARGTPSILVAEVLEPNPAHPFYAALGFLPVAWSCAMATAELGFPDKDPRRRFVSRDAGPRDALAISLLETTLATRRRAAGDLRFDPPRAVDATLVGHVAAHLSRSPVDPNEPLDLVTALPDGRVHASACVAISPLDPPFVPSRRAIVGRFALDPALDPQPLMLPLLAAARRRAAAREAPRIEITDLTHPGSPMYDATLLAGGRPWSRVVQRAVPPQIRPRRWR